MYINNNSAQPSFAKFIKIEGKTSNLKKLKSQLHNISDDFTSIIAEKNKPKSSLYILSGVDYNNFLELLPKFPHFKELKRNLELHLNKAPIVMKYKEAAERLKNEELAL